MNRVECGYQNDSDQYIQIKELYTWIRFIERKKEEIDKKISKRKALFFIAN